MRLLHWIESDRYKFIPEKAEEEWSIPSVSLYLLLLHFISIANNLHVCRLLKWLHIIELEIFNWQCLKQTKETPTTSSFACASLNNNKYFVIAGIFPVRGLSSPCAYCRFVVQNNFIYIDKSMRFLLFLLLSSEQLQCIRDSGHVPGSNSSNLRAVARRISFCWST